nr:hypothetical protein [Ardenticatenales bacterium]
MSNKTLVQVIVDLLQEAGGALHYRNDIYEQIRERELYDFGETSAPWQTIHTLLSSDKALFAWMAPGMY